jgi:hypothetical protein
MKSEQYRIILADGTEILHPAKPVYIDILKIIGYELIAVIYLHSGGPDGNHCNPTRKHG